MVNAHLFDKLVGLIALVRAAVGGEAALVKCKAELPGLAADSAVLEAALTELLSQVVEDLDVVLDVCSVVLGDYGDLAEGLAVDDILCVGVRKLRRGPVRVSDPSHCTLSNPSLDDGPPEPLLDDLRVLSHGEDDRERKAVLARQKTADLLAQRRR